MNTTTMSDTEYTNWRANLRARGAARRARRSLIYRQIGALVLSAVAFAAGYNLRPKYTPELLFTEMVRVYGKSDARSIWLECDYAKPHPSVWGDVSGETGSFGDSE